MAIMVRRDLATARATWLAEEQTDDEKAQRERSLFLCDRDEAGKVFDFHSLRHSFLTNLARSGVHHRVMQAMARHSDPKLPLRRYTHVDLSEQGDAAAGPFQQRMEFTASNRD